MNATGILQKKYVASSGHQSFTPFLSGAPLLKIFLAALLCTLTKSARLEEREK